MDNNMPNEKEKTAFMLSEISPNGLKLLTAEQKSDIVFGDYADSGLDADIALLLGSSPDRMPERVRAAAKLYKEKRVKYIIPTGGVEWEIDGEMISESHYMTDLLIKLGVPKEAVIPENEARTTRENMICSLLTMQRIMGLANIKRAIIVTSPDHLRRSLGLGKWLIPRNIEVIGYASESEKTSRKDWQSSEESIAIINNEVRLLRGLVCEKNMDDIEFKN